jgi:hypothetical protein
MPEKTHKSRKETSMFKGTTGCWARNLRKDDQTIAAALGKNYKAGNEYTAREIFAALNGGDEKSKRQRLLDIQIAREERENRLADGLLCDREKVNAEMMELYLPFKKELFELARQKGFEAELIQLHEKHFRTI